MAKFNRVAVGKKTTNLAGGNAYLIDPKLELVTILLTSFVKDSFYRSASDTTARLVELVKALPYEFSAKAALVARREFGMRSITHVVGGEIAKLAKGLPWTKRFFKRLFKRPDDMLEIVSYYSGKYGLHPLPNSLKKAIRERLEDLDEYSISKYRGEGKSIKLVDLVNLAHPRGSSAIGALVKGNLKSEHTWEARLSKAGQVAKDDSDKERLKADAWKELLQEGRLGYLACLRNLRNIIEQADGDTIERACYLIEDEDAIAKALIFPFQYVSAIRAVSGPGAFRQRAIDAIAKAMHISCEKNVPSLPGETLIAVDWSGSMYPEHILTAAIFAGAFWKNADADMFGFGNRFEYVHAFKNSYLPEIANKIVTAGERGGTDFTQVFNAARSVLQRKYDRIIILSDMQSWAHEKSMSAHLQAYRKAAGKETKVIAIDLTGYRTAQFPEHDVYCLAGLSDKIFNIIEILETDRNALVKKIEAEYL